MSSQGEVVGVLLLAAGTLPAHVALAHGNGALQSMLPVFP